MSVNGVTGVASYEAYQSAMPASKAAEENTSSSKAADQKDEAGVVYEASNGAKSSASKTYTQNTELVNRMKADAAAHAQQLQNIVTQLMSKQGQTYNTANGIWSFLSGGDFKVDAATKAQAQKDISEDGYWGVNQTSDRIIDFAKALTGGDPSKIEEMRDAFKKGYKMAEDTWGGKLPDISKQTYDAVMEKFDQMAEEAGLTTSN